MSEAAERTWASEEMERRVKDTFPIDLSPEEFAARDGYGWLDFPFARFRYRDPKLDAWIQAVKGILQSPEKWRECQTKYLTQTQKRLIDKYLQEDDEAVED